MKLQFNFIKKGFPAQIFLVNSAKFLITLFLKNTSDGCFRINTRSVYFPTMTLFFSKRCHTYFLAEQFLGLIYRQDNIRRQQEQDYRTRVSSIARRLFSTQWNICDGAFLSKIVNSLKPLNIFAKKAPLQMFDQVLKTPLQAATKRCSKVKN